MLGSGHSIASGRLAAMDNTASWLSERLSGLSYLTFLRGLVEEVERDWPAVQRRLERIQRLVVGRRGLALNVTADRGLMGQFRPLLGRFVAGLPGAEAERQVYEGKLQLVDEAIIIPTQVQCLLGGGRRGPEGRAGKALMAGAAVAEFICLLPGEWGGGVQQKGRDPGGRPRGG